MTEIEKMKRYIERTKMEDGGRYKMQLHEAFELAHKAKDSNLLSVEAISLAFEYGRAKGYRAAKREVRA